MIKFKLELIGDLGFEDRPPIVLLRGTIFDDKDKSEHLVSIITDPPTNDSVDLIFMIQNLVNSMIKQWNKRNEGN